MHARHQPTETYHTSEAWHAPWALVSQFSVFFSIYMSFSSFPLGWDIVKFRFCILSFQASCTLILHLTDVNPGPEYPQIFPFVPCKPFFFFLMHYTV